MSNKALRRCVSSQHFVATLVCFQDYCRAGKDSFFDALEMVGANLGLAQI